MLFLKIRNKVKMSALPLLFIITCVVLDNDTRYEKEINTIQTRKEETQLFLPRDIIFHIEYPKDYKKANRTGK